ncbi:hypothetical protein EMOOHJMP_00251 [Microcystis phage MaAM05]|nr:hypothetical protein EMOOHJMP_00251 [Microcystis phage MaAM05]
MVFTLTSPVAQNNGVRPPAASVRSSRTALQPMAGRKKAEGNASKAPQSVAGDLKARLAALTSKIPDDVKQKAQEAAAKANEVVDAYVPQENRKAIEEKLVKTVESFNPDDLEGYKANLKELSDELAETVPDEGMKKVVDTYLKSFLQLQSVILDSVKDVGGSAMKVASGDSSVGDFTNQYRKTFVKAHQDTFKAHANILGANVRLGGELLKRLTGAGGAAKAPAAEAAQAEGQPDASKAEESKQD